MLDLRNGDCLEILKDIPSKTIDLVFADLPYGQINCKWDCKIDLELLWKELLRVAKSDHTPFFFTATTKFGYELIKSNEKMFKYDLVWAKSNPCGFLQAKKQPMRKHEMLYVFYKKQPAYDISSHKHKFKKEEPISVIKEDVVLDSKVYGTKDRKNPLKDMGPNTGNLGYDPPLPTSVIKEEVVVNERGDTQIIENAVYGNDNFKILNYHHPNGKLVREPRYDPPLPTSVIKEDNCYNKGGKDHYEDYKTKLGYGNRKNGESAYDPPLPTSVIKEEEDKEEEELCYGKAANFGKKHYKSSERKEAVYDPPLPTSVIKEEEDTTESSRGEKTYGKYSEKANREAQLKIYDPPLPTSLLEIKSIRLKQHSTAKPPDLMKWILKYYSKEGDTILDPTMGSNPMGLACKEMNRKFIGIEMDETIYNFACDRVK